VSQLEANQFKHSEFIFLVVSKCFKKRSLLINYLVADKDMEGIKNNEAAGLEVNSWVFKWNEKIYVSLNFLSK
jgi:hypothetical protein